MNLAAAASSIFLSCRKRLGEPDLPASWTGLGAAGCSTRSAGRWRPA